jgi:hypothetical protein
MKYQQYIKIALLCLGFISSIAYGQKTLQYDMEQIKDVSLLELKVLQEWHPVATNPSTQQKIVEITLCNFENGRKVRIPVTYVLPDTKQACHFIVSYGNLSPTVYKEFDGLMTKMLENNIGFVLPAIGPTAKMKPHGPQLEADMKQLYKKTGNIKYDKTWLRGVTYMRAITAALTEKERFLDDKIACDGRSKSAGAGAAALIHCPEVTGLYARVFPSSIFPEFYSKKYKEKVEQDNQAFFQQLAAGEIAQLGTIDDDAYEAMRKKAKKYVAKDTYPKFSKFKYSPKELPGMVLTTENLDVLKEKNAQYYFFVGTNDNITMDVPRFAEKYPDYPIAYYPGGRHGGLSRFLGISGTPDSEEAKANRIAFFSQFYLGQQAIMEKPEIQYHYQPTNRMLSVTVTFRNDTPKKVALHYAFDRFTAGSEGYEYDLWEQQPMKKKDKHSWQINIVVPKQVKTVSMLSFQEGEKEEMTSYSSSNYTTVQTK